MNVLLTGGPGFVGKTVLGELRARGHTVRLLARTPWSPLVASLAARHQAEIVPGDILDPDSLTAAAAGAQAAIHLVGIISEAGRQTFARVHVEGTRNVIGACQKAGVQRLIHMSALGTRPGAVSRYHQSKWAAEEAVRQSGLDYTIFRPSIIYGPEDQFVNLFARLARWSPILPIVGAGRGRLQPVAVTDVARCFVGALTQPASIRQTLDLAGPETFTLAQIIDLILQATGRRRLKLPLPLPGAWLAAIILECVFPRLLHRAPPLNRDQLLMLREDNVGNPQPACDLFHMEPLRFGPEIARYLAEIHEPGLDPANGRSRPDRPNVK